MIKSNIILFVRNLQRQRLFAVINLLGLTLSIASTLVIYLYVSHEFSYDNFHPNVDRLYRVNQTFIWGSEYNSQFSRTGPGVAHALREELPEVELVTSFHTPGDFIISYVTPQRDIVAFDETKVLAADSNFFKVFNYPLIHGDAESAFDQANTLIMTKSTAKKYFGDINPVGELVQLGGLNGEPGMTYEVTGVLEDTPDNSTMQFEVLLSMKSFPAVERFYWSWVWTQLETFVVLKPNANIDDVREKLKSIPRKRAAESIQASMGISYDEYIKSGKKWDLFLQPVTSMHLPETPVIGSFPDVGNLKIIYSFIGAAIFILLLSCINFMNLSAAQFTRRIKEAGIRKILGLRTKELRFSYFFEALTFCLIAMTIGFAATQLLLPQFSLIAEKDLELSVHSDPLLAAGILVMTMLMAGISSSYPTIFLTSFNPVSAMKGRSRIGLEGRIFRNGLVVFQFSVSIILIICTAIVFQQLNYASAKDMGFDKENLILLHHAEAISNEELLANAMSDVPGVINATYCSSAPPQLFGGDSFSAEGLGDRKFQLNYTKADENYIPTLGIKIIFGRNFQEGNPGDPMRIILNETAIQRIGWELDESVIGKYVTYPNSGDANAKFEVIGVMADFNFWSISYPIEAVAIVHSKNKYIYDGTKNFLVVRVEEQNIETWSATLEGLHNQWNSVAGHTPFDYSFVDENFAKTFSTQKRFGNVLSIMAILAIVIASLGLLGIIVYSLEQRTKEIGIRKVSGASLLNILTLISKGYTRLILIAFLIAAPLSYYMMQFWLMDFAYAITPSWWIFILAGGSTLLLATLITSYHAVKAAMTNPVEVLRDE